MTLLDRLKPEYKEKLNDAVIKILLSYKYLTDLTILEGSILCINLANQQLNYDILQGLFFEIKQM